MTAPTALVGCTGFVGGNLATQHVFDEQYHSTDVGLGFGHAHSLVVYAGVPAEKYLANADPAADRAVVDAAFENLRRLEPERVVLLSTVDVYRSPCGVDEASFMPLEGLHAYGADRLRLEGRVRQAWPGSLVLRLPALFGPGLKKNFVYDLIRLVPTMLRRDRLEALSAQNPQLRAAYIEAPNGFYRLDPALPPDARRALKAWFAGCDFNALSFTDSRARYQFYNLEHLWADLSRARDAGLELLNITSEPLSAAEVYRAVRGGEFKNEIAAAPVCYDVRTRHSAELGGAGGYLYSGAQVLSELVRFVRAADAGEAEK